MGEGQRKKEQPLEASGAEVRVVGSAEKGRRRVITPAMLAALLYGMVLLARLVVVGGNPGAFVVAGDRFVDRQRAPEFLPVLPDSPGYDGTFYYRLALNPGLWTEEVAGIGLDTPRYRAQRILYPLLGYLIGRGDPYRTAWSLIGINYAGLILMGCLGGVWAQRRGWGGWWGVLVVLYPGFLLTLHRDLTEIVAGTCLLGAMVGGRSGRPVVEAIGLSLGCLARETLVVAAAACALHRFIFRSPGRWWSLLPLVVFGVWQAAVSAAGAGYSGAMSAAALSLGLPGVGPGSLLVKMLSDPEPVHLLWVLELSVLVLCGVLVLGRRRTGGGREWELWAWAGYLAMLLLLSRNIWCEDWAFMRAGYEYFLTGLIVLRPTRSARIFGWWCAAVWLAAAAHVVFRP